MMSLFVLSMKEFCLCKLFIYRKLRNVSNVDNLSKICWGIVENGGTMLFSAMCFLGNGSFGVIVETVFSLLPTTFPQSRF